MNEINNESVEKLSLILFFRNKVFVIFSYSCINPLGYIVKKYYFVTMSILDGKMRGQLFKQAHKLKPVILIGQNGLTEGVLEAINQALDSHELIKVKFNDFKEDKKKILGPMTDAVRAELIRVVGHVAVLYRQQPDPDKRQYFQETLSERWED